MLTTRMVVFMLITLFIGLFHFGVSRLIKEKDSKSDRDKLQMMLFRAWGKRGLTFSLFMLPVYLLRDDIFLYTVLAYIGLLGYNSFLLKQGIRKLNELYQTNQTNSKS